jgi:cytochrome P450
MLPDSIPHVPDAGEALTDPIQFLMRARANHGNLFAIRKQGPIFSRSAECEGVVAAFGLENQRAVLTDIESFGLPVSAAENMKLPPNLVNLNRSLHSMRGAKHSNQKRLLIGMINGFEPSHRPVWEALEELTAQWTSEPVELMKRMRDLTFHASLRVLFGNGRADTRQLALLLQTYFHLRRETASVATTTSQEALEDLATVGNLLDSELREFICGCCKNTGVSSPGMFANLAAELETRLSEDEIVGHMNVFFISTTEPVAIALSWILLVLSQLPELRIELRNELEAMLHADAFPEAARLNKLALLDSVINETLRLFSPNALMVRVTTKPVSLNGIPLPAHCEVILSPFISHRDETVFHHPNEFLPSRWRGPAPSPFVYFPFGAGGHSCIGRSIALDIIKTALAFLLPRFEVLLSESQDVDWAIRIQFMPSPDPVVMFYPFPSQSLPKSPVITGPVARLLNLESVKTAT